MNTRDYTVNLPKTSFPMKADLANREPDWLAYWRDIDIYKKLSQRESNIGKFILHDGPPYANGEIHLGHAVNKILKDITMKAKMLSGFAVFYVPGWDCHGLAIEVNVEKKYGRAGEKIAVGDFVAKCREYAAKQIDLQREAFIRLGVFGDWDDGKCYKTMDFEYEANIVRALAKIIGKGYVERGYKAVHWCITCGSALAEAEVEYIDKKSSAIDVSFTFKNPEKLHPGFKNVIIPIWTTTPWTLPANEAVALHPDFNYILLRSAKANQNFIVVKELVANVMARYGIDDYEIVMTFSGRDLEGFKLQHPFLEDKEVPIILGEHVTLDAGTGAVHTAPAHGQEDHIVGLKYNLPMKNPVDAYGKFIADTPFFAGESVFDANCHVIKILKERGNLLHEEEIIHSYPHCWRHKTPLIFRAAEQWFIGMDKVSSDGKTLREKALAKIDEVTWIPEQGRSRIRDMVSKRPYWCISRQRIWNAPMAMFIHKKTCELHPKWQYLMEKAAEGISREGIKFWYELNADSFLHEHASEYPVDQYEKVNDTLDVWFDSGVSHFAVLSKNPELTFPADLYLEGGDQYRGWFQSSLLTSIALNDTAPYKQVMTHGMTVDADGRKMSKSLGNVIAPQKIIGAKGADILRLWAASLYLHNDLSISEEILERNVDSYRIIRNTARFLLGNLFEFDVKNDLLPLVEMLDLDRFMVEKVFSWQEKVRALYESYNYCDIYSFLIPQISLVLSSLYFSIIKDRLYTMSKRNLGRKSAQSALYHILEILMRCFAPILSFTAEEIWQEMKKIAPERNESIFLNTWYEIEGFNVSKNICDWEAIFSLRQIVNNELEKLRADGKIGSSLEAEVVLYCDRATYDLLSTIQNKDELRFVFIVSNVVLIKLDNFQNDVSCKIISDDGRELSVFDFLGMKCALVAKKSAHKKCCRCWHLRPCVGSNLEHPELCARCVDNLFALGEKRTFA